MKFHRRTGFALFATILALPGAAFSQNVTPSPSQTAPQQNPPARQQVILPKPETPNSAPASVNIDSHAVGSAPCPLVKFDNKVSITRINFESLGGKSLAPEIVSLLAPVAAAPPAGDSKLSVVCEIRDRATTLLREGGYIASVQIPPQRIEDGVLRLEVITGHIVDVRVKGDVGPYRRTIGARIAQLKKLDPLNEKDATRILLYANEIPGLHVQLSLRPAGAEAGALIGDLTINYQYASIVANVQNYGSTELGRWTGYARAELYGITGQSDLAYLAAQTTSDFQEQQVVQGGYAVGVGRSTLALDGTYAWSRPSIGSLDLRARSLIAEGSLKRSLMRALRNRHSTALNLVSGLDLIEQRTEVFGTGTGGHPLNRDRLRTAFLRVNGDYRRLRSDGNIGFDLFGSVEARKGLDILGATKPSSVSASGYTPSRFEGHADATVLRGNLSTELDSHYIGVASAVTGQWTDKPLLNYDEFAIGNLSVGRGYDPGANSGDRLIGVSSELRLHTLNGQHLKLDVFGFYDTVWLWNLDTNATENDRNLRSYGGGLRFYFPGRASLEVTYARPRDPALLLAGARTASDRLLVSFTTRFGMGGQ